MKKVVLILALLALLPATAGATSFTLQSYSVTESYDSYLGGLHITTKTLLGAPYTFSLDSASESTGWLNLLKVGTDESSAVLLDGWPRKISVQFNFSAPPPPFGGPVTGTTWGEFVLFGPDKGHVHWGDPLVVGFGRNGKLKISLSDAEFGTPGEAVVRAQFQLEQPEAAPVPEPASMLLLGTGLVGLAGAARRRLRK